MWQEEAVGVSKATSSTIVHWVPSLLEFDKF